MHPRPKAQRRGKARATPTLQGQRGRSYVQVLKVGQQIQRRGGEGGQAYKGRREMGVRGLGKASFEASCQFQTNHFMYIPPRGSSSQQTIFLFLLNQGVHGILFFTKHLAKQPGQVSRFITG